MEERYVRKVDYKRTIPLEELDQLTDGDDSVLIETEEDAVSLINDYLSFFYEVDEEFGKGYAIGDFSPLLRYPIGSYFWFKDYIYKVVKSLQPSTVPGAGDAWDELTIHLFDPNGSRSNGDYVITSDGDLFKLLDELSLQGDITDDEVWESVPYSIYGSNFDYNAPDVVKNGQNFYIALKANGFTNQNVSIPGNIDYWTKILKTGHILGVTYSNLGDYVTYDGKLFQLEALGHNISKRPDEDGEGVYWTEIEAMDYNPLSDVYFDGIYAFGDDFYEITENDFSKVISDNPEKYPSNYLKQDPRNKSLVRKLIELSVYYVFKRITPDNIPVSRIKDYDECDKWLDKAARFKLNPNIAKKSINKPEGAKQRTKWTVNSNRDNPLSLNNWFY